MKHYKNINNELWAYDDDCFAENGTCINEVALKVIEENNLVEITEEELEEIINYITKEEEILLKEQEELKQAEELTNLYEKLEKLGWS